MPGNLQSSGLAPDPQDMLAAGWATARPRLVLAALAVTLLALVLALVAIGLLLQSIPVFGTGGRAAYRDRVDLLSVADTVAIKAAHALRVPRYKVGLFGNSRSVEVAGSDIGLAEDAYFNFSVGGTSFRQTVAMLEYLSRHRKAPQLSIVSIDNHDIEFTGTIYWPPLRLLPQRLVNPVPYHDMSGAPAPLARYLLLNVLDALNGAREQLRGFFNFVRAQQMVRFVANVTADMAPLSDRYRADGARSREVLVDNTDLKIFPGALSDRYAHLIEMDLARLARLQAGGMRIVIYETPIHPKRRDQIEARRTDRVRTFRSNFFAACRRDGLTCLPAPDLTEPLPWVDCCHAPPALLGRFIAGLL